VLYGLYKFAEKCNAGREDKVAKKYESIGFTKEQIAEKIQIAPHEDDYKAFTLSTLLDDSIDRDGVSPTRIFGLSRDEMAPLLLGLSSKYHEFINASFRFDLERITLADDKSSYDVLGLFAEVKDNG
jgi:hypothetical protein